MNNSKILYVFGASESLSHLHTLTPQTIYWGLAAAALNCDEIINYSSAGQCFDNIIHMLLNEEFNQNAYFLIGVPPIVRRSVFKNDNSKYSVFKFNKNFDLTMVEVDSMTGVSVSTVAETSEFRNVAYFSHEWNQVSYMEKILLLHSHLKYQGHKFIIANSGPPFLYQDQWPQGKNVTKKIADLPELIMFSGTLMFVNQLDNIKPVDFEKYSWVGHHGPIGHKNYYDKSLSQKMKQLNWI